MAELRVLLYSFHHGDALAEELRTFGFAVEIVTDVSLLHQPYQRKVPTVIVADFRGVGKSLEQAIIDLPRHIPTIAINERKRPKAFDILAASGARLVLGAPYAKEELAANIRLLGNVDEMRAVAASSAPRFDSLTGATSASAAREWLANHMAEGPLSLMLISPADFSIINEAFGSDSGDIVLRAMVQRIQRLVAEQDGETLVARLGGTKLGVALAGDVSEARVMLLARAISDSVESPFSDGERRIQVGCQIGIVRSGPDDATPVAFIKRARAAQSSAVEEGRSGIYFAEQEVSDSEDFTKSLYSDLRAALDTNEIEVLYQPQVAVGDGKVTGVEALARWQHPDHGELGAATLFAVAEQSGYLGELSRHVQARAIADAAAWPEALSALRVSINVTASDIDRTDFVEDLAANLETTAFPPGRLTIELTETSVMRDIDTAVKTLSQVRAIGCRVAIDDFGTGYSSLAWLKALPADYLKIDKGLADDIVRSAKARKVVTSIIALARSLGMRVIAEGVETQEHLDALRKAGCSTYQGYLCAPALNANALEKLVRNIN